ncbi:MAG: hypothetical protein QM802_20710 [Agriterribacter sp.]
MIYKIKQVSPGLWIITLLATIFAGMGLLIIAAVSPLFDNNNDILFPVLLILIPFIIMAFILPRYTASRNIEIELDDTFFRQRIVTQYLFQKSSDYEVQWVDIRDFLFEPGRQFDKFKITNKNGEVLTIFHNNDVRKDDFLQFRKDFEQRVSTVNREKNLDIRDAKTIYETGWGVVLAIIAIAGIIGIPILLYYVPTIKPKNYTGIGVFYLGAIFFLFQVIIYRTKNKSK